MLETLPQVPSARTESMAPTARACVSPVRVADETAARPVASAGFFTRTRPRDGRLGKVLARRRPLIFAPLFTVALVLTLWDHARPPLALAVAATVALTASSLVRVWATGYRTWVRGSGGVRHLMTAGPYAYVRHPLYVANGLAGAAALVLLWRLELLALYVPLYVFVIGAIVAREEEALDERYGPEHAAYRARMPRFIPRPWRTIARSERTGDFSWAPVATGLELWKVAGLACVLGAFLVWS